MRIKAPSKGLHSNPCRVFTIDPVLSHRVRYPDPVSKSRAHRFEKVIDFVEIPAKLFHQKTVRNFVLYAISISDVFYFLTWTSGFLHVVSMQVIDVRTWNERHFSRSLLLNILWHLDTMIYRLYYVLYHHTHKHVSWHEHMQSMRTSDVWNFAINAVCLTFVLS